VISQSPDGQHGGIYVVLIYRPVTVLNFGWKLSSIPNFRKKAEYVSEGVFRRLFRKMSSTDEYITTFLVFLKKKMYPNCFVVEDGREDV